MRSFSFGPLRRSRELVSEEKADSTVAPTNPSERAWLKSKVAPKESMPFAYLVHHPTPYLGPHWGQLGLRFYGLGYVLGFIAAAWLFARYARAGRSHLPAAKIPDLMMALVVGVMVGGRVGSFLLYRPAELLSDPWAVLRVWEPGMASHGGFVGVAIAVWWFSRRARLSFFHLGDLIVSAATVGLGLVRIANFLNGELWGKVTSVPWAIIFDESGGGPLPRHPSQLYEAALEGALLFGLLQWRFWRTSVVATEPGRLTGEFLLGYALVRIVSELFREPDAALIFGLSRGTFYSLFLLLAGALLVGRSFLLCDKIVSSRGVPLCRTSRNDPAKNRFI